METIDVSNNLYKVVKSIGNQNVDWNNPADVWKMWVKRGSKSWKYFVLCCGEDFLYETYEKIDRIKSFFRGYIGDVEKFADDWIPDSERHSFFMFYAKGLWVELQKETSTLKSLK